MTHTRHVIVLVLPLVAVACSAQALIGAVQTPPLVRSDWSNSASGAPYPPVDRGAMTPRGSTGAVQSIGVRIPSVVFTSAATARNRHLRVPVAVTEPMASGYVWVEDVVGCYATLKAEGLTWVECQLPSSADGHRLHAVLSDGSTFEGPEVRVS